jgi:Raf kinase inhibitor-like YbhB/YbcL family protein
MALRLWSNDFVEGGTLPMKQVSNVFGHQGENKSPHLAWDGVPEGTKSFVLTMYDPDAPTGSGWWHWTVVDIPANVRELPVDAASGTLPAGSRHTRNDLGNRDYVGAAPPPGRAHRYIYTLRALSVESLSVPDDASGAFVGFIAGMHGLAQATLTVTFGV